MEEKTPVSVLVGEVQLILAEKRTSLAVLRTGIAVLALPVSVLGLLVATSKYYTIRDVLGLFLLLLVICLILAGVGVWLMMRAITRIRHQDAMIKNIKRKHSVIAEFLD